MKVNRINLCIWECAFTPEVWNGEINCQ